MASIIYNALKQHVGEGFDWVSADVRLLLLDAAGTYTPDPDDEFVADLDPGTNELDADNYVRKALSGKAVNLNTTDDRAEWVCDNVIFSDLGPSVSGPTIQAAVLYVHDTDDSDSWLVAYLDDVTGQTNGLDATIAFDASGIIRPS